MKAVHVVLIVVGVCIVSMVGCCGAVGIMMNSVPKQSPTQIAAREKEKEAERLRYDKRNDKVQEHLKTFLEFTKDTPVTRVSSYSDKIKVTVSNQFFLVPKQVRLQFAQNFLSLWIQIHCPDEPQVAGLKIVDQNDNEIGGSRAGKVWVNE